jgi:hypothetical protein
VLGTAAEATYHRGDYRRAERLARPGLERATDDGAKSHCLLPLSVARGPWPARPTPTSSNTPSPRRRSPRGP